MSATAKIHEFLSGFLLLQRVFLSLLGECSIECGPRSFYNNKIWILFAMSAYSLDELKFTSS